MHTTLHEITTSQTGTIKLVSGAGTFPVYRRLPEGRWVKMTPPGQPNTQVALSAANPELEVTPGLYAIRFPSGDVSACPRPEPEFVFTPTTTGAGPQTATTPFIASYVAREGDIEEGEYAPDIPEAVCVFGLSKPECCEVTVSTSAGEVTIPANTTNYTAEFNQDVDLRPITLSGDCLTQTTLFVQHP